MLDDTQIAAIVANAEQASLSSYGSGSDLANKRAKLLKYYNQDPFGDEIEGQSKIVTSDVSDVVESILPSLVRQYTQAREIAKFAVGDVPASVRGEELSAREAEADQKTKYTNHVFRQRGGLPVLYTMIKDALLQYTGTVKVYWDSTDYEEPESYRGLSKAGIAKLKMDPEVQIKSETENEDGGTDVDIVRTKTDRGIQYECIPPEEMLINEDARDFVRPRFIGQRTPKTRSELIEMGFDPDIIKNLSAQSEDDSEGAIARRRDLNYTTNSGGTDKSQDKIFLGEYYILMDLDEDGVSELWQVFFAGHQVLEKKRVDSHPYATAVPIPIPHRAIGTCPADQVADIQFVKSTLVRQYQNNIYQSVWGRHAVNERVDLDDFLNPRAGGVTMVDGQGAVQDSIMPIPTIPVGPEILQGVEYWDTSRETRTGITRYNQGLDTESLNKTATGFKGLMDASQQRLYLLAKMIAESGIKAIFEKTANLLSRYQDEAMDIRVFGRRVQVDPGTWQYGMVCEIDVGIGSGDRNEKIAALQTVLAEQKALMATGSMMVDETKMFATYDQLISEIGLNDVSRYFNDTSIPDSMLKAQNEQARKLLEQMEQMGGSQNPLAEAEQVKAHGQLQATVIKEQTKAALKTAELEQKDRHHQQDTMVDVTNMELKYKKDLPGGVDADLIYDPVSSTLRPNQKVA